MEYYVKLTVVEGKGLGHVRADYFHVIPFALRHKSLAFKLLFGVVEDCAFCSRGGKERYLLTSA